MSQLIFNPEHLLIHSFANEPAVNPEHLSPEWLRQRFARQRIWTPESTDEHVLANNLDFRPASVLIPIVIRDHGLTILLTQRAANLNHHAGQISFPGGRVEKLDSNPVETALREAEEEVGLERQHVSILGTLPDYKTGTGYQVTPVVSLVQPPFHLKADPGEVASIFEVPLAFLMDGKNHQRRAYALPDGSGERVFYAMPYQKHFIWGATAGMLRNLFHMIRA
ncbi:CoA pyrophosphatase [Undibacterium sp. SXout7W]|uniref:CoA pyrophosphatase n=1 Tax=Undibacterium sp. SXout7W TaxID=3413049 RepID=UPI003BF12A02